MKITPSQSVLFATLAISSSSSALAAPTGPIGNESVDFNVPHEAPSRSHESRDLVSDIVKLVSEIPVVGGPLEGVLEGLLGVVHHDTGAAQAESVDDPDQLNHLKDLVASASSALNDALTPITTSTSLAPTLIQQPSTPALPVNPPNTPTALPRALPADLPAPIPAVSSAVPVAAPADALPAGIPVALPASSKNPIARSRIVGSLVRSVRSLRRNRFSRSSLPVTAPVTVPGPLQDATPALPVGAPDLPVGAPDLPVGAPGLPVGVPNVPAAPALPVGAPALPVDVPGAVPIKAADAAGDSSGATSSTVSETATVTASSEAASSTSA
jgi:hypothetical protein